jgi:hypothetical protein
MSPTSDALYRAAQRLDESPTTLLNGGASDALLALNASQGEITAVAHARGVEVSEMDALWTRAASSLREVPADNVYAAAAEAASLLYTAAWMIGSDTATSEDLRAVL